MLEKSGLVNEAPRARSSRQQRDILALLQTSQCRLSASEIFNELLFKDASISLATVYRTVSIMTERGKLCRFVEGDRVARYEPNTAESQQNPEKEQHPIVERSQLKIMNRHGTHLYGADRKCFEDALSLVFKNMNVRMVRFQLNLWVEEVPERCSPTKIWKKS